MGNNDDNDHNEISKWTSVYQNLEKHFPFILENIIDIRNNNRTK